MQTKPRAEEEKRSVMENGGDHEESHHTCAKRRSACGCTARAFNQPMDAILEGFAGSGFLLVNP
jgi:hypothetical protein